MHHELSINGSFYYYWGILAILVSNTVSKNGLITAVSTIVIFRGS